MHIPNEKLLELQKACLVKITEFKTSGKLRANPNFLSIMYRWKSWSTGDDWKKYIQEIIKDDQKLIDFLKLFIWESYSHTFGGFVNKKTKSFNYKSLENFTSTEEAKKRLEDIKTANDSVYINNKDLIDMFLDNFGKKSGSLDD